MGGDATLEGRVINMAAAESISLVGETIISGETTISGNCYATAFYETSDENLKELNLDGYKKMVEKVVEKTANSALSTIGRKLGTSIINGIFGKKK